MNKHIKNFFMGILLIANILLITACIGSAYPISPPLNENHYLNHPNIDDEDFYHNPTTSDTNEEVNNVEENNEITINEPTGDNNNPTTNEASSTNNNYPNSNEQLELPTKDKNLIDGKDTLLKATTAVNIRSLPTTNSSIVGTIIANAMVPYIAQTNNSWYETIYKGKTAFISKSYCKLTYFSKGDLIVEKILDEAKLLLGFPYIYGAQRYHWGNGNLNKNFVMGQFDCSSLTQYAYYKGGGIFLDLTTRTQVYQGAKVNDKSQLKRGDLMFFTNSSRRHLTGTERVGHVAIYLGDNYILHTASTYAIIEPISTKRWNDYIIARRFV